MPSIYLLLPFVAVVAILVRYLQGWYKLHQAQSAIIKKNGCLPAKQYPHRDPFIGLDLLLTDNKHVQNHTFLPTQNQRFKDIGNTYWTKMAGFWILNTNEPENFKAILATDFGNWGLGALRYATFRPLMGPSIFAVDGKEWEHSRSFLRPQFVRKQFQDSSLFEKHVENLLKAIPARQTVDLQELFHNFALDSATDFLLGESVGSLLPDQGAEGAAFADAFFQAQHQCGQLFRKGPLAFFPPKSYRDQCKRCHDWIDIRVGRKLKEYQESKKSGKTADVEQGSKYVLLNELVQETDDPIRIRNETVALLIAGRDTTAATLSSLWFTLARHPEVVRKLRDEIAELGGEKPSFERLKNMKYLQMTMTESKVVSWQDNELS